MQVFGIFASGFSQQADVVAIEFQARVIFRAQADPPFITIVCDINVRNEVFVAAVVIARARAGFQGVDQVKRTLDSFPVCLGIFLQGLDLVIGHQVEKIPGRFAGPGRVRAYRLEVPES